MASKKYDSLAALADEKPGADDGDGMDTEEGEGLPPEFESAAVEAFPDLEGEHSRLQALYDAISACHGDSGGKPGLAIMIGSKKGK
jgi:hypothetical protein